MFADVTNDMTIAQEEIFGPVVSIITYEDEYGQFGLEARLEVKALQIPSLSGFRQSESHGPGREAGSIPVSAVPRVSPGRV